MNDYRDFGQTEPGLQTNFLLLLISYWCPGYTLVFVGFLRGQMSYFYLALAIAAEVAGTSLLKVTEEFSKLIPTTFLVIFYIISFWLMTLALRELPLGVVYAVWSGLGIVLVAIIGAFVYKEVPDLASMIGMALIISGVVVMHLFSKSIQH